MKRLMSIAGCFILLSFFSCKKEKVITPPEPVKDISGSWKIIKALRNGTDLTSRFDFSTFRIKFADSSYTITNMVPFIVNKSAGTWHFDDPLYPFKIVLSTSVETKTSGILYPVVDGVRNIVVSFSPGCTLSNYQYTLQKEN